MRKQEDDACWAYMMYGDALGELRASRRLLKMIGGKGYKRELLEILVDIALSYRAATRRRCGDCVDFTGLRCDQYGIGVLAGDEMAIGCKYFVREKK